MRDSQPSHRDLRNITRGLATLVLLLAGCLNPRPEELPSAGGLDGVGEPPSTDGENAVIDRDPAQPVPANPGPALDPEAEDPSAPATNTPPVDGDGGADRRADAGAPDAGD